MATALRVMGFMLEILKEGLHFRSMRTSTIMLPDHNYGRAFESLVTTDPRTMLNGLTKDSEVKEMDGEEEEASRKQHFDV